MNLSTAFPVINAALDANLVPFLWGAPGIGKSQAIDQIAKHRRALMCGVNLALLESIDLRGIPAIIGDKTVWLKPGFWPSAEGQETVLFFDDMDRAPSSVQAAAMQIILDRRIGEHVLPDAVRIVGAGNGGTDRTGTNKQPRALANRLLHLDIEPDSAAWAAWAATAGIDPALIAFIRFRPTFIHGDLMKNDTTGAPIFDRDARSFPSSRAWESVNRIMGQPDDIRYALTAGLVSNAVAAELEGFIQIMRQLPSVASIVASPMGAIVPDMPAALFAVSSGLARHASAHAADFGAVATYAGRLPKEFETLTILDATRRNEALKSTLPYAAWAVRNAPTLN